MREQNLAKRKVAQMNDENTVNTPLLSSEDGTAKKTCLKKVIALAGTQYAGKTEVLKRLADDLKAWGKSAGLIAVSKKDDDNNGRDFREALELSNAEKTLKIGICTSGDDRGIITENFKFLAKNDCQVAVMACRATVGEQSGSVQEVIAQSNVLGLIPYFVAKMKFDAEIKDSSQQIVTVNIPNADKQTIRQLVDMIV